MSAPTAETNSAMQNAKDAVVSNASAAYNAVQNHPLTQNVTNTVANAGPVADNVREQSAKTQAEFSNLAAARQTPKTPAATGQQLTHYHSFFSSLLSWDNPRASGVAYLAVVTFIFAARYFDVLRYAFKATWMTLGVTVLAEVAGKLVLGTGLASQVRPKSYYTIPKETLDSMLGDVHELINFFVIESQRIVFAENVLASVAAFLGAFTSYFMIKWVPLWGMALIGSSVLFLAPLIYKTNREVIDHYLAEASEIVNQQTEQVKKVASYHASRATETTKQYVGDYSAKAQEYIGNARAGSTSSETATKPMQQESTTPAFKAEDFPEAPKAEFKAAPASTLRDENEPLIAT